jgi:molybdopterin molybdotransferase
VRIFTGSVLPAGADAVVMQEDTRPDANDAQLIWILDTAKPWENLRFAGEDLKPGAPVAQPGDCLTAGRLGLLAAIGFAEVPCFRQPTVGLLATGNELVEGGPPIPAGKIYESNRVSLASLASRAGGVAKIFPLVKDTLSATCVALEAALTECNLVVTAGGVSVGELDLVKSAFQKIGGEMEFWKIAIKPGKPFGFGRWPREITKDAAAVGQTPAISRGWREKLWFGLPGNPVSAFVTFLLLVRPAVLRCQGASNFSLPLRQGTLVEPLANPGDRRHFVRVMVDDLARVRSAGVQASHLLSSLAEANGLVDVPPRTTLTTGAPVNVLSWE